MDDDVPKVMAHFAKWGMEVHYGSRATNSIKESKTEILFVAKSAKLYKNPLTFDGADLSDVKLGNGRFIPIVAKFCYLGTSLTRDGDDILDVKMRIEKAGAALGALREGVLAPVGYHHMRRNLSTQHLCCQFSCTDQSCGV